MRNLKCALGRVASRSQYGVLAELWVKLINGLARTSSLADLDADAARRAYSFHADAGGLTPVGN